MNDRPANSSGHAESVSVDIDAATRRLMAALDALESAVERRRDADRDENELAARIQALGADRSRLADELDGSLVKSRKLERTNREIAERLDAAIGTIRSVLDTRRGRHEPYQRHHQRPAIPHGLRGGPGGAAAQARRKPGDADRSRCAENSARSAMRASP